MNKKRKTYFTDSPPINNFRCCSEFGSFVALLGYVKLDIRIRKIENIYETIEDLTVFLI